MSAKRLQGLGSETKIILINRLNKFFLAVLFTFTLIFEFPLNDDENENIDIKPEYDLIAICFE